MKDCDAKRTPGYTRADVIQVFVFGLVVLVIFGYFVTTPELPGLVIPFGIVWIGACLLSWRQGYLDGRLSSLGVVPANCVTWLRSAFIFGLVMPAIFPDGAYDASGWLMWVNACVVVIGLCGAGGVRLFGACVRVVAKKRLGITEL